MAGGLKNNSSDFLKTFFIKNPAGQVSFKKGTMAEEGERRYSNIFKVILGEWSAASTPGIYEITAQGQIASQNGTGAGLAVSYQPTKVQVGNTLARFTTTSQNLVYQDGESTNDSFEVTWTTSEPVGTTYQWSYERIDYNSTAHSNPQYTPDVTFTNPTGRETQISGPLFWFSNTPDTCNNAIQCFYTIKCTVTPTGQAPFVVGGQFQVRITESIQSSSSAELGHASANLKWDRPIGQPQGILINLNSVIDEETFDGDVIKYTWAGWDGNGLNREVEIKEGVLPTSQFYQKMIQHEQHHVGQLNGTQTPNLSDWFTVSRAKDYVNHAVAQLPVNQREWPGTTDRADVEQAVIALISNFASEYHDKETDAFDAIYKDNTLGAIIEKPAYDISDTIEPLLFVQYECSRFYPKNGSGTLPAVKTIQQLYNAPVLPRY